MSEPQWPLKRLKDITSKIGSGATPRGGKNSYLSSGISLIRSLNVYDFTFEENDLAFISEAQAAELSNVIVQPDDILLNITGASVARCCLTDPEFLPARVNQHVAIVRVRPEIANARFVLYCINSRHFKSHLLALAQGGATREALTKTTIEDFEVLQPPLPIQRRIAGILSAYDELIENSQRRIKILESMARALYREWFVHFRFPGHESVPRVPSPLGDIPQGWEVKSLFALTKVNYGKNLPTKKLADDGAYPVYGAAKIIGRYTEYTREQRTIICGCRGSVGEMQITQPQCYVTNNSFTFDPTHPDTFFWLFHTLKERGLRDVVGGAAQPQITLDGISSVELVTPPLPLRTRFQRTVTTMFEQAWTLDSQTQNLRRTRDLLLPRLLSGQIDVEAMAS
jgi:type I restriction enzyme S subunit